MKSPILAVWLLTLDVCPDAGEAPLQIAIWYPSGSAIPNQSVDHLGAGDSHFAFLTPCSSILETPAPQLRTDCQDATERRFRVISSDP